MLVPPLLPEDAFQVTGYGEYGTYRAPATVVICFQSRVQHFLIEGWTGDVDVDFPLGRNPHRQLLRVRERPDVGVMNLDIGVPVASYAMHVLGHFGTTRFVFLTSAGALCDKGSAIDLFQVISAQRLDSVTATLSEPIVARSGARMPDRQIGLPPVHAITVDAFFRFRPLHVTPASDEPAILEMEAHGALRLASELDVAVDIIGYVSDGFTRSRWVRRREIGDLQRSLAIHARRMLEEAAP